MRLVCCTLFSLFLILVLFSCNSETTPQPAVPEKILWEDTKSNLESDLYEFSYTFGDELFLVGRRQVIAVNKDLDHRLITTFDKEPFRNPYPVVSNGIFATSVLKSYLAAVGSATTYVDSVTVHLVDTRDGLKGQFNLTALRAEVAGSTNMGFDAQLAAVNSSNEIIVLFKNYDDNLTHGVIQTIRRTSSQLQLTNKRLITVGPLEGLTGLYAVDENFIVSTNDHTYKVDGRGNVLVLADNGIAGEPFYFNEQWNFLVSRTAYYESPDGDIWKNVGIDRGYGAAYMLGVYDGNLWFRQEEKSGIYFTKDLKTIEEFKIGNDAELDLLRLKLLDGYIYGKGLHGGELYRVKLPKTE